MLTYRAACLYEFCFIKSYNMKKTLQAEEMAQLLLSLIVLYLQPLSFSWWIWILLFLSPDISMLGYLIDTRAGAYTYNFFHHKLIAAAVILVGYGLHNQAVMLYGILLYAHSSFDRMMGYGLKYPDSFNNTHLGPIGKAKKE